MNSCGSTVPAPSIVIQKNDAERIIVWTHLPARTTVHTYKTRNPPDKYWLLGQLQLSLNT